MKRLCLLLSFPLFIGCKPEINHQIIAYKYVEGFHRIKFLVANNANAKRDEKLLPLIDSIIFQTNTKSISYECRQTIVEEYRKIPKPRIEDEQERFNNLEISVGKFQTHQTTFLEDLRFIDAFLAEKYYQHWACNMGIHRIETLLSFDTLMLSADREYELPIRIEYNGMPSSVSIISNSIQGSKPNTIRFKTHKDSMDYQTIRYECEAINEASGETMKYNDEIVVQIIKND